jgi:hypothetical protein
MVKITVFRWTNIRTNMVTHRQNTWSDIVKNMVNNHQNTWSHIVKKHCQTSSTNMVKHQQQTWSTIVHHAKTWSNIFKNIVQVLVLVLELALVVLVPILVLVLMLVPMPIPMLGLSEPPDYIWLLAISSCNNSNGHDIMLITNSDTIGGIRITRKRS